MKTPKSKFFKWLAICFTMLLYFKWCSTDVFSLEKNEEDVNWGDSMLRMEHQNQLKTTSFCTSCNAVGPRSICLGIKDRGFSTSSTWFVLRYLPLRPGPIGTRASIAAISTWSHGVCSALSKENNMESHMGTFLSRGNCVPRNISQCWRTSCNAFFCEMFWNLDVSGITEIC